VALNRALEFDLRLKSPFTGREVRMANDPKRPDFEDEDEPTEEEIRRQERSRQDWKHDDSRELSDRDEERPLKP
jgi:hypothetical protein